MSQSTRPRVAFSSVKRLAFFRSDVVAGSKHSLAGSSRASSGDPSF